MNKGYYPPVFMQEAFHCPYPECSVFAEQTWSARVNVQTDLRPGQGTLFVVKNLHVSRCYHCGQDALWVNGKLIFPESNTAPLPNADMPEDVKGDYLEAVSISGKSPRGAAGFTSSRNSKIVYTLGTKR